MSPENDAFKQFTRSDWEKHGLDLDGVVVGIGNNRLAISHRAPSLYQRIQPAKITAAREQMGNFSLALDSFFVDMGRYPTSSEGLAVLRVKPDGGELWKGPYLQKEFPADPWGKNYIYRSPGRNGGYEIVSYGEDSREGGEGDNADINSWESGK